jgi:hypothetical protein
MLASSHEFKTLYKMCPVSIMLKILNIDQLIGRRLEVRLLSNCTTFISTKDYHYLQSIKIRIAHTRLINL